MRSEFISFLSEPQKQFFRATTRFVAYGGSRGGGKSWSVRKKATLLAINYPGINILLLRRTYPELRENHIRPLLSELYGIARYKETEKCFFFPGGSRIRFGYCDSETDVLQYQGQEYDVIFMDEATQFSEYQFSTLTASLRGANDFPKRFYLTCNPGGVGHGWVKRLFVDRQYTPQERPENYTFIRARVYDNKPLLQKDPDYLQMLRALPPDLRKAWLEGDWDIFVGQYFSEWKREVHVLDPFPIPDHWHRYFSMDYGLDMLAGYWIAMDTSGRAYVYREVYQSGLIISEAAKRVLALSEGEEIRQYMAPPDLWNRRQDTGQSAAEIFAGHGIYLTKAQNDRVQGWYNLKEWLRPTVDELGLPSAGIRVFENCHNLIRTLPALQYDQRNANDAAGEPHELTHAPDALRYFVAGRPLATQMPAIEETTSIEQLLRYR